MLMTRCARAILATSILVLSTATSPGAAITSTRSTTSAETWSTSGIWSNTAAPSAGNTYESAHILRTATTFGGDSLTVIAGGVVALKPSSTAISNLHMNGGSIQNYYADNNTATLNGALYIDAPTSITPGTNVGRINAIASTMYGDKTITITGGSTTAVNLTGTNNPFTGNWVVNSSLLKAIGSGSLGSGNLTVNAGGKFDADSAIDSPSATFTLLGQMVLDQSVSFGTIIINGDTLAPGTYTFAELNTAYDAQFADGGTGTLTVVPEPASLGMVALSLLALRRPRRR